MKCTQGLRRLCATHPTLESETLFENSVVVAILFAGTDKLISRLPASRASDSMQLLMTTLQTQSPCGSGNAQRIPNADQDYLSYRRWHAYSGIAEPDLSNSTSSSRVREAALHMVSAWGCANGVVLGQLRTSEKSNEITAIPALLELLDVRGCIVTIDAMGCQRAIAAQIRGKRGHYVLAVKENQGALLEDIRDYFEADAQNGYGGSKVAYHEEADSGHGRIEVRRC